MPPRIDKDKLRLFKRLGAILLELRDLRTDLEPFLTRYPHSWFWGEFSTALERAISALHKQLTEGPEIYTKD